MRLQEIVRGSKAHHDLVASANAKPKLTVAHILRTLHDSTMSANDVHQLELDITHAGLGNDRVLSLHDLEQLCVVSEVDFDGSKIYWGSDA